MFGRAFITVFVFLASSVLLGNDLKMIVKFDEPVDVQQVLSDYDLVSWKRMGNSTVYRVVIQTTDDAQTVRQQLNTIQSVLNSEDSQAAESITTEPAASVDQRTISILDGLTVDQRTISILDGQEDPTFFPLFSQQYIFQVHADQAWSASMGEGVVVAVIDTGVDIYHGFLSENMIPGWDFVDDDDLPLDERYETDSNGNGLVDEGWGHGTHVAGIIKSIAPQVSIMPLRAIDSDGNGDLFDVMRAMQYAMEQGANVINLSMSIDDPSPMLLDLITDARMLNILVVTSAGNANSSTLAYPATESETLTVTSVDDGNIKSWFANFAHDVDIAAPGEHIVSCLPGNQYVMRSGTSMAAPIVSGQAALIMQLVPGASFQYVKNRIVNHSQPINDLNPGYRNKLGRGLADAWDSITLGQP